MQTGVRGQGHSLAQGSEEGKQAHSREAALGRAEGSQLSITSACFRNMSHSTGGLVFSLAFRAPLATTVGALGSSPEVA